MPTLEGMSLSAPTAKKQKKPVQKKKKPTEVPLAKMSMEGLANLRQRLDTEIAKRKEKQPPKAILMELSKELMEITYLKPIKIELPPQPVILEVLPYFIGSYYDTNRNLHVDSEFEVNIPTIIDIKRKNSGFGSIDDSIDEKKIEKMSQEYVEAMNAIKSKIKAFREKIKKVSSEYKMQPYKLYALVEGV